MGFTHLMLGGFVLLKVTLLELLELSELLIFSLLQDLQHIWRYPAFEQYRVRASIRQNTERSARHCCPGDRGIVQCLKFGWGGTGIRCFTNYSVWVPQKKWTRKNSEGEEEEHDTNKRRRKERACKAYWRKSLEQRSLCWTWTAIERWNFCGRLQEETEVRIQ